MKKHKEKAQAGQTSVRPNTDDLYETGLSRSSDEAPPAYSTDQMHLRIHT